MKMDDKAKLGVYLKYTTVAESTHILFKGMLKPSRGVEYREIERKTEDFWEFVGDCHDIFCNCDNAREGEMKFLVVSKIHQCIGLLVGEKDKPLRCRMLGMFKYLETMRPDVVVRTVLDECSRHLGTREYESFENYRKEEWDGFVIRVMADKKKSDDKKGDDRKK